jgi:chitodextrinase
MRLIPAARGPWSWSIGGGLRLTGVKVDTRTYTGTYTTQSWSVDNAFQRMTTNEAVAHNYKMGFAYGSQVAGSNSATSYLWTYTTEKSALPFSQVWLRPRLSSSTMSYPAIPASGTSASTVRGDIVSSRTSPDTPWGVTGISGPASELNMEVEAFARIGSTMYVGGGFQYVQKGANPAPSDKVKQSYLAAFDVVTGEWLRSFAPVVNGMVWDLQALPDGRLAVGGEFTSINGVAGTSALAVLDPTTGAVSPSFLADVTYPNTSGLTAQVKTLDYADGWLYAAGRFTRVSGGVPQGAPVTVGRATRVRATDGKPDGTWKPNFDGTVVEMDASSRGDRVYMAGYFDNVNFESSPRRAVVSTAAGAANVPGMGPFVPSIGSNKTYQQAIIEVGNNVWIGGSEHDTQMYDRDTFTLQRSAITRAGGDTQALAELNGVVYMACHCGGWVYSDTNNYSNPIPSAADVANVKYIAAFDAATGALIPDFYPSGLDTRSGIGGWALEGDQYGCLWFGGDFDQGSFQDTGYQWLGGFGKLCPGDTTAPSAPTGLSATSTSSGTTLTWGASTDAGGTPRYEVLRDDRVVATVGSRTYTDPITALPADYWVRAIDAAGNRSASTPVLHVAPQDVQPPSQPRNLSVSGATSSSLTLTWDASTDDTAVTAYRVWRDGAVVQTVTTPGWTDTGLAPSSTHTYAVDAGDAAGNWSAQSTTVQGTTLGDTTPPAAVSNLVASPETSGTAVDLSWTASSSPDVVGYTVARSGTALAGPVTTTSYRDDSASPSTTYTYTVYALDGSGNQSPGTSVDDTTPAAPSQVLHLTWPGATGSPWPSTWTTSASSGTAVQDSGRGALQLDDVSGAYARAVLSGQPAAADQEVLMSYTWNARTAVAYENVFLRGSGGWQNAYRPASGYGLQLSSSAGAVSVQRTSAGVVTTLATLSGARQVSTATQWIRLRVDGSQISVKTWVDGTPEPVAWTWTGTDTAVTGPGQLYVSHVRGGTNVGAKTLYLGDLDLTTISH